MMSKAVSYLQNVIGGPKRLSGTDKHWPSEARLIGWTSNLWNGYSRLKSDYRIGTSLSLPATFELSVNPFRELERVYSRTAGVVNQS
jgi:hypothetical protein